ncbi:MAG: S-layer homology domain-containing protein [Janthinobacterium lividum]
MQFPHVPILALSFLFAASLATSAAPTVSPRDLPSGHWAAGSVKRVLHENIMGTTPDSRFQGDQPVTRYELAVALDRFVRYIEAAHKPLHAQTFPAPKTISPAATPTQRQALTHLVSNGFLPAQSPLLKDGRAEVTAKELSAALASVTIALSDRAEAPDKN